MFELQEIVDELEKLHNNKYTTEQLRAWGHMMMMKKHDWYEHPPDKPFSNNVKKSKLQVWHAEHNKTASLSQRVL